MPREHKVAEDETPVLHRRMSLFRSEHNENHRGTIKRIRSLFPAADAAVVAGDSCPQIGICHSNDDRRLLSFSAGRIQPGFDYLIDQRMRHLIRFELPNATALNDVLERSVHRISLLSLMPSTIRAMSAVLENGVMI